MSTVEAKPWLRLLARPGLEAFFVAPSLSSAIAILFTQSHVSFFVGTFLVIFVLFILLPENFFYQILCRFRQERRVGGDPRGGGRRRLDGDRRHLPRGRLGGPQHRPGNPRHSHGSGAGGVQPHEIVNREKCVTSLLLLTSFCFSTGRRGLVTPCTRSSASRTPRPLARWTRGRTSPVSDKVMYFYSFKNEQKKKLKLRERCFCEQE